MVVKGSKAVGKWNCFRSKGVVISVSGIMAVIAAIAFGCGGGTTQIVPFAGVWVANAGGADALHFSGAEVHFTGSSNIPPKTVLNSITLTSPQDTLFDSSFGMWVVDGGANDGKGSKAALYHYVAAQLGSLNTTSNPAPAIVIKSASFNFPQFAALDSSGNLWVSDSANNEIFKFSKAQATTPSAVSLVPAATLTNAAFNGPLGIAFDSGGNLWIENNNGTTIVEVDGRVLAGATGMTAVALATTLNSSAAGGLQTIKNPWGLVFDSSGDLWITNEQLSVSPCSGSVVEFLKAQITGGGNLTPFPNVVLKQIAVGGTFSLCDPNGITMNAAGTIVVANAAGNSLSEYSSAQIGASGNPTPKLFINGSVTKFNFPTGLTYGPLELQ
jgi:streptogramin lyase